MERRSPGRPSTSTSRGAGMRMGVVNRKRSMSLPGGSWRECEDKRGAEKEEGIHGVSRESKCARIILGLGKSGKSVFGQM